MPLREAFNRQSRQSRQTLVLIFNGTEGGDDQPRSISHASTVSASTSANLSTATAVNIHAHRVAIAHLAGQQLLGQLVADRLLDQSA